MTDLPYGWITVKIGDITLDATQHQPLPSERFKYVDIAAINRECKKIESPQMMVGKDAPSRARKLISRGDTLVSMTRPNLNAVALVDEKFDQQIASTGFDVLRPVIVDPRWIFYCVRSDDFVSEMSDLVQGALYPAVRSKDVRSYLLPLAPINEQKRIADKLDAVLSQVEACRKRLDRVTTLIERFRQAVLDAIISDQFIDSEIGNSKETWKTAYLHEVCNSITDGDHQPPPKTNSGIPFITISAISQGTLRIDRAIASVSEGYYNALKSTRKPEKGDILFSVTGSIAIPVIVNTEEQFTFQRHIAILKPNKSRILSKYLFYALKTTEVRNQAFSVATGTAQLTVPLKGLNLIEIPLPPILEQEGVVKRVDALFTLADQMEKGLEHARKAVERITPTVLAKAFRGELVEQNPDDEPASVLLERIRTTRAEAAIAPKPRNIGERRVRKQIDKQMVRAEIEQMEEPRFTFVQLHERIHGDYEDLSAAVMELLPENKPCIEQEFDMKAGNILFERTNNTEQ